MINWNGKIIVIQVTQYFDSFNNIMNEQKKHWFHALPEFEINNYNNYDILM